MKKIIATVLAAVLAVGTISLPASAASDDNKPKGLGILPALAGPLAIGTGMSGPSISTWTSHKYFKFYKWDYSGWNKVHYLKDHDWTVYKKVHGYKVKVHARRRTATTSAAQPKASLSSAASWARRSARSPRRSARAMRLATRSVGVRRLSTK